MTREDVVQAALTVERWCAEHCANECYCPLMDDEEALCLLSFELPKDWMLERQLRTRGLKHE